MREPLSLGMADYRRLDLLPTEVTRRILSLLELRQLIACQAVKSLQSAAIWVLAKTNSIELTNELTPISPESAAILVSWMPAARRVEIDCRALETIDRVLDALALSRNELLPRLPVDALTLTNCYKLDRSSTTQIISSTNLLKSCRQLFIEGLEDSAMSLLRCCTGDKLNSVEFRDCGSVPVAILRSFGATLTRLSLVEGPPVSWAGDIVRALPQLISLELFLDQVCDVVIADCSALPALEHLVLCDAAYNSDLDLSDLGLLWLTHIRLLKSVKLYRLSGSFHFSDLGLLHLSSSPQLESLVLSPCPKIGSQGGITTLLTQLASLSTLHLQRCENLWTPLGLPSTALARLKAPNLDDEILSEICTSFGDSLKELNLAMCKSVSSDGMVHLGKLVVLEVLVLNNCSIAGDCLKCLVTLPLRKLAVRGCRELSVDSIIPVLRHCALESLDMTGVTACDDLLVREMATCSTLQVIKLRYCTQVSVGSLELLSKMPLLGVLDLVGCCNCAKPVTEMLAPGCFESLFVLYLPAQAPHDVWLSKCQITPNDLRGRLRLNVYVDDIGVVPWL